LLALDAAQHIDQFPAYPAYLFGYKRFTFMMKTGSLKHELFGGAIQNVEP